MSKTKIVLQLMSKMKIEAMSKQREKNIREKIDCYLEFLKI
jgi:hypothetical protein